MEGKEWSRTMRRLKEKTAKRAHEIFYSMKVFELNKGSLETIDL